MKFLSRWHNSAGAWMNRSPPKRNLSGEGVWNHVWRNEKNSNKLSHIVNQLYFSKIEKKEKSNKKLEFFQPCEKITCVAVKEILRYLSDMGEGGKAWSPWVWDRGDSHRRTEWWLRACCLDWILALLLLVIPDLGQSHVFFASVLSSVNEDGESIHVPGED